VRALVKLGERRQKTALRNRQFYFECSGNRLPFRKLTNSSPAVSALTQSWKITAFEICTYKNKELKTYCNQHLQKNRARAGPFHYYETAGSAPARIAFGPDEDSG
jgi:hypothetical protein